MDEKAKRLLTSRVLNVLNDHPDWTLKDLKDNDNTGLHNEVLKFLYYDQLWGKKKLKEVFDMLIKK